MRLMQFGGAIFQENALILYMVSIAIYFYEIRNVPTPSAIFFTTSSGEEKTYTPLSSVSS